VKKKTEINILTSADEKFTQHLAVMIASVLYNSQDDEHLNFYVITEDISDKSRQKISELNNINFFNITYIESVNNNYTYGPLNSFLTTNAYHRFEAPSFLPELSRVLYLDCDLIVRNSLKEFWYTDIGSCAIGAVENLFSSEFPERLKYPTSLSYFNSGVILMNLDKLRELEFEKKCFDYVKTYPERIWYPDQCVMNAVLQGNWKRMPYKYNFMSIVPHKNYKPE
jgi:lipopolysaccharide biosynthesis glycosyltransferase